MTTGQIPERYFRLASAVGGEVVAQKSGAYCRIDTAIDPSDRLGELSYSQIAGVDSVPVEAFSLQELPGHIPACELVCFDTETTGLGGTGAVPFLIGCGRVTPEGFSVRQYLLPDYADEPAALGGLLSDLSPGATIVTYNGAAFDLPLVRDRLILNRIARELPVSRHIDLLHPTRRLFKRRLKDCSLVNIERELFGHIRQRDIPGYLIPSVYFEWLNDEATANLQLVLEHNRQDIVTLLYLCHRIAQAFVSSGDSLSATDDLHSLSRVYGRRQRHDRSTALYNRMENESEGTLAADIQLYHSYQFKRSGEWGKASRIWESLAEHESREGYWACLELAKYYEHREPDFHKARTYTLRAIQICPYSGGHKSNLTVRLGRIARLIGS